MHVYIYTYIFPFVIYFTLNTYVLIYLYVFYIPNLKVSKVFHDFNALKDQIILKISISLSYKIKNSYTYSKSKGLWYSRWLKPKSRCANAKYFSSNSDIWNSVTFLTSIGLGSLTSPVWPTLHTASLFRLLLYGHPTILATSKYLGLYYNWDFTFIYDKKKKSLTGGRLFQSTVPVYNRSLKENKDKNSNLQSQSFYSQKEK